jgi:hypothetical protein
VTADKEHGEFANWTRDVSFEVNNLAEILAKHTDRTLTTKGFAADADAMLA